MKALLFNFEVFKKLYEQGRNKQFYDDRKEMDDQVRAYVNEKTKCLMKMILVTRNSYAKLCGISRQAIHDRIKRGTLSTISRELPDGSTREYIDISEFPPKINPGVITVKKL